jgi:hypothetical protein
MVGGRGQGKFNMIKKLIIIIILLLIAFLFSRLMKEEKPFQKEEGKKGLIVMLKT